MEQFKENIEQNPNQIPNIDRQKTQEAETKKIEDKEKIISVIPAYQEPSQPNNGEVVQNPFDNSQSSKKPIKEIIKTIFKSKKNSPLDIEDTRTNNKI